VGFFTGATQNFNDFTGLSSGFPHMSRLLKLPEGVTPSFMPVVLRAYFRFENNIVAEFARTPTGRPSKTFHRRHRLIQWALPIKTHAYFLCG